MVWKRASSGALHVSHVSNVARVLGTHSTRFRHSRLSILGCCARASQSSHIRTSCTATTMLPQDLHPAPTRCFMISSPSLQGSDRQSLGKPMSSEHHDSSLAERTAPSTPPYAMMPSEILCVACCDPHSATLQDEQFQPQQATWQESHLQVAQAKLASMVSYLDKAKHYTQQTNKFSHPSTPQQRSQSLQS
jgi:hypothetical protein